MSDSKKEQPPKPPEHVEVYFDVRDGGYWYRLNGRYVKLKKADIQLHFRSMKLRDDIYHNGIREIDWPLWHAQNKRLIDYAGSLAGHRVGMFKDSAGRAFLVTDEAGGVWNAPEKKTVEPVWFKKFIEQLLPGEQSQHFCYWLAVALKSLRDGDFRPGQVVVLAGPSQCGKSLLQAIITEIFGGRSAGPFRYMMAETQFNQDLVCAEHWQIEDPASTTDIRTRRLFGCKLKECTVNRDFSIHQKGKDALTLPLFRRVTLSVNEEPENLAVVPPLDASIMDKLFLFKCSPADVGADRKATWAMIQAEIPIIRSWLLKAFKTVPKAMQDDRFGVKAWHHPDLFLELTNLSPEMRLLNIIDHVKWGNDDVPVTWSEKALTIEEELRQSRWGFAVEKLLHYSSACGTYLAKLAKLLPERVTKKVKDGIIVWAINPPKQTE